GLVSVKVRTDVVLVLMVEGANAIATVGTLNTLSAMVLLVAPAPVSFEETGPVTRFWYVFSTLLVTLTVIVQVELAAIVAPFCAPASVIVLPPPVAVTVPCVGQVSATLGLAATVTLVGRVSVKETLWSDTAGFGSDNVKMSVVTAFTAIFGEPKLWPSV